MTKSKQQNGHGLVYDAFDAPEYEAVFTERDIHPESAIVKAVIEVAENAEQAAFDLGCDRAYKIGEEDGLNTGAQQAIDACVDDLATYISLAKSDPQSAAVYFHRATGRHLFEVQQPCLL